MVFSSYEFILVFLPVVLLGVWLSRLYGSARAAIGVLCLASFAFYAYWDWRFLPLLLASIIVNHLVAGAILRGTSHRKTLLIFGIAFNLLLLGYFKYFNFFVENWQLATGDSFEFTRVILPIGISFFTFQQIAYLTDVYTDKSGKYSLVDYALFVSFFPQLIAGPIVHHKEIMPQLSRSGLGRFSLESMSRGIVVFVIGLGKKVLIADTLGSYADTLFAAAGQGGEMSAFEAWGAAAAYGLQLYFDFSGYADMAIGLGLFFGIRLPENFDRPYAALSIRDFWRRWHMTLSRFLRDYLYIPLGGSRHGRTRQLVNLMLTMVLGGIWHGAGWTFLLWGMLHGLYLVIERVFGEMWARFTGAGRLAAPLAWLLTMAAVFFAWVPFRAEGLEPTLVIWQGMLLGPLLPASFDAHLGEGMIGLLDSLGLSRSGPTHLGLREWVSLVPMLVAAMALAVWVPNGHRLASLAFNSARGQASASPVRARLAGGLVAVIFVGAMLYLSYNPVFLYFQF